MVTVYRCQVSADGGTGKNFSHTTRSQPVSNIELNGAASCEPSVPTARRGPSPPTLPARYRPATEPRPPRAAHRRAHWPSRKNGPVERQARKTGETKKKKEKNAKRKTKRNKTEKKNTHTLYLLTHTLSPSRPSPTDPSTHHTNNPHNPHPPSMVHDDCSTVSIYIYIYNVLGYKYSYITWHITKETYCYYTEHFFRTYVFFHFYFFYHISPPLKKQKYLCRYYYTIYYIIIKFNCSQQYSVYTQE